jgi:pilus assembly protein CpaF
MSFHLLVHVPGAAVDPFPLTRPTTSIGTDPNCDLQLVQEGIEPRHAALERREDGCFQLRALAAEAGTYVNDHRVVEKLIRDGDVIRLGRCELMFQGNGAEGPRGLSAKDERQFFDVKVRLHRELMQRINLRRLDETALRSETERIVRGLIREFDRSIPAFVDRNLLLREMLADALGLGPLEELLADPSITEVMVNRRDQIYVERDGKLMAADSKFLSDEQVLNVIQRIVAPLGRSINEAQPMVDARLPDGSRVNAIIPPLAISGPALTIRKFSKVILDIADLIELGSMSVPMGRFLRLCVEHKRSIAISGGTGSGKTTLLNILASFIPPSERIITVEDAAELKLPQEHLVSLEARPSNVEGKGEVTFRDLVINSLRMRPDRIIVGECRGGEAIDMLQAMNTGHEGSLTTVHANSPRDALSRLETMVLMSGLDLPSRAIRDQIASAIDVIVQTQRFPDGSRKVTRVTEIVRSEHGELDTVDVFRFRQTGMDANHRVTGEFLSTGVRPRLVDELAERGTRVPWEEE